jgi:hypothetical protein
VVPRSQGNTPGPAAEEVTAKEVASWSRKAREATLRRDEAIRAMRAEGATLRAIAESAGLTHTAIAKILSREADASGTGTAL